MSTSTSSSDRRDSVEEPRVLRFDDPLVLRAEDVRVLPVEPLTGRGDGSTQRVTSARGSHTEDVGRRMRTYAISMGIRTLCVLGAILAFPHWYAWLFVPGAVVLPYVAVVLANAGRERAPLAPAAVAAPLPSHLPVLRVERRG